MIAAVARHLEEMCTRRMQAVMIAELLTEAAIKQSQAGPSSVNHGLGDSSVQRDHRVAGHPLEQVVERRDLTPVGVSMTARLIVDGSDRGLSLVLADLTLAQCTGDQRDALGDRTPVPA
jgi:hypothetical protein